MAIPERSTFVHNIWRAHDIKFSNCKIDAAYVTPVGRGFLALSCLTVSRVSSSFHCKATPRIVQGRVIHFLPDSAQLFINCCSLEKKLRTVLPLHPLSIPNAFYSNVSNCSPMISNVSLISLCREKQRKKRHTNDSHARATFDKQSC